MSQTASFSINRMTFELRCDDAAEIELNYNDRLSDIYNKKFTSCSPAERVLERAKPYGCFCFCGVQRTEISGLVWQLLARLGDPNAPSCDLSPYLLELTYELASTVFAPVSTIADLSYVTFGENLPIRFLAGPNDVLLHNWIYLEKSRTSLSCWLDKVSTFKPFHNFLGSEQEVAKKFLTAIELYSSQLLLSSKKQGILGILYKKITLKIRLTLKLFLRINTLRRCREYFRMKELKPLSKMIRAEADSLGKGFDFKMRKVDIVELEEVSALIREFHTTV